MSGELMLKHAATVIADRRKAYGDPSVSMTEVAQRWSITLKRSVTPAEVVLCMIDLKLARLGHDPKHHDSAVDVLGYTALLPELTR
jgi:hypothetical protein